MGRPEMAGKHKNLATQVCGPRRFVGPIWEHPVAAGREILPAWSSGRPPPPWPAHVQCWWPESAPTAETLSI